MRESWVSAGEPGAHRPSQIVSLPRGATLRCRLKCSVHTGPFPGTPASARKGRHGRNRPVRASAGPVYHRPRPLSAIPLSAIGHDIEPAVAGAARPRQLRLYPAGYRDVPRRKAGERRRLDIRETVEAEAMPAADLRELLRETVEAFMPAGALAAAKVAEESEREGLSRLAGLVNHNGLDTVIDYLERGA